MGNQSSRPASYHQYYEVLRAQNGGQIPDLPYDSQTIDPYQVLGVGKNFTWDELKTSYRMIAKHVHPDKGGSPQVFNIVTDCFRKLAHEYKMRVDARPHHELKKDAQSYFADRPVATRYEDEGDFLNKFNKMFQENKLDDEEEGKGYAHMMAESSVVREDINIPKKMKKFQSSKFNELFDKNVPVSKDVVVYRDPEPLDLARKLNYTELGGKTDDFSSAMEKGDRRGLQFTDYMKAHTTTRLVDPKTAQRKEYKNIEEYEAARARSIGKPQTSEEARRMEERKLQEQRAEEERLRRLRARDDAIRAHHESLSRLEMR